MQPGEYAIFNDRLSVENGLDGYPVWEAQVRSVVWDSEAMRHVPYVGEIAVVRRPKGDLGCINFARNVCFAGEALRRAEKALPPYSQPQG